MIGTAQDLTYDYIHLGNSTKTLLEIAEGKHPFCSKLANAKTPMILIGAETLERNDGDAIYNILKFISNNTNVINKDLGWNGFNILHKVLFILNQDGSRVGALDLGILPSKQADQKKSKVIVLLGCDDIKAQDIPKDSFVIYIV